MPSHELSSSPRASAFVLPRLNVDAAVRDPDRVRRDVRRSRWSLDLTIANTEAGPVPRTSHDIAFYGAFRQWAPTMCARVVDRIAGTTDIEERSSLVPGSDQLRLSGRQVVNVRTLTCTGMRSQSFSSLPLPPYAASCGVCRLRYADASILQDHSGRTQ